MRGICLGLLLALIMIGVLGMAGGAFAACPADDTYINISTILDGGNCDVDDTFGDGLLRINGSDLTLDCNGTVFNNVGFGSVGINATGHNNVTIKNCTFIDFSVGVYFWLTSEINIVNSSFLDGHYGLYGVNSTDPLFQEVYINNSGVQGIELYDIDSGSLEDSTVDNSFAFDIAIIDSILGITNVNYTRYVRGWGIIVNVTNYTRDPIDDAMVDFFYSTNVLLQTFNTTSNGILSTSLPEYMENETHPGGYSFNPFFVNVTKPGYDENSSTVTINSEMTIHILLNKSAVQPPPPADTGAPSIDNHSVTPQSVANGSSVVIRAGASDNVAVDSLWVVVDYPGAGSDTIMLANEMGYIYNVTLLGRHDVTFFANDTSGNATNLTTFFDSFAPVSININVSENDGGGVDSDVTVYQNGTTTQVASFSSSSGNYQSRVVPNGTYDMQFAAFSGDLIVLLENVEIWNNLDNLMRMDDPPTVSGFQLTYAAETDYSFGSAVVRVYYSSGDVSDENNITLYVCHDWNFSARYCNSTWNETSALLNTTDNYFELSVSGFSAFSIMQNAYCGDGVCSSSENSSSCSADCNCTNGQTRLCALNNVGACGMGSETCVAGSWSGCPSPLAETCNQADDDCDGTIDNVGGGNSIITTFCGCYDGASPASEIFDGIDNNCNGFIDDGCVCNESETDVCGSNIGACVQGSRTCTNCKWGTCDGQIGPFEEVCGNGMDDDCDGQIDEIADCIVENNETCAYGPIPATGCKCGIGTYASGYCCNGVYKIEPCPDFPWWILIIVGGAVLAVVAIYYFLHEKAGTKSKEDEWATLEKKYTPAKM